MKKKALVCGAGGFIGNHLVSALKADGFWVRGVDLKLPEFSQSDADSMLVGDLRDPKTATQALNLKFDEVYQLAADMGGAGYLFNGDNDAAVLHNSALINLNVLEECRKSGNHRVFYSSSACIYPKENQNNPSNPNCAEDSVYPANPDSDYGWEKLFAERLYLAHNRNHGMQCRIARYHNIFGPFGVWSGGREKAPAAICRKVAMACDGEEIEIWGDGKQTRSFLHVDECIVGTLKLMRSEITQPLNIGSSELISINALTEMVKSIAGKENVIRNIEGPVGVAGRVSDNRLIRELLDWAPSATLERGMRETYDWVNDQVAASASS